jgi:hypothetical protein
VLEAGGVKAIPLPARRPNLNAFAERWVRSVNEERLLKLILFGERPLARTLARVQYSLSRRTQSPRKREQAALPRHWR